MGTPERPKRQTGIVAVAPVHAAAGSGSDSGRNLGLRWAALRVTAGALEVAEDGVDDVVVEDEGDHAHLTTTVGTGDRKFLFSHPAEIISEPW